MKPKSDIAMQALGIRIEGINLSYGSNHVLRNVDLDIGPGELFAFLGPSGCGKTTLLRLIAGFKHADTGRVLIGGQDISGLPPWKRDVGMVFQSYALWPHMSVARNVAFGLEERSVPRAEITKRVKAALDLVGLTSLGERRPSQLSGGQQQRVALARTIAIEPKVLLLDEPLSNLDAKLRVQVRRELRDLQQRLGLTTIFVTHDQEEANTICDRIAVMNEGLVQQVGTPRELYEQPVNLFVASFLGTANILEGRVTGEGAARVFEAEGGLRVPIPPDASVPAGAKMTFRPQDVTIIHDGETPDAETSDLGSARGILTHREFLGANVRYSVRIGGANVWIDTPFRTGDPLHDTGSAVRIAVARDAVRWLAQ